MQRLINSALFVIRSLPKSAALLIACGFIFSLSGCTATTFLKEGESFYSGAEIKLVPQGEISNQKRVETMLETFVNPKPNAKIFGSRTSVWFYYIAGDNSKKKGIRNFIQTKLGSPPVLIKDVTPAKTAIILQQQVNNDGYFKSTVSSVVETKNKESKVRYTVILQPPFRIGKMNYIAFDTTGVIGKDILNERLLKENQQYALERLQAEQHRIEEVVRNHGLYYFDSRYLLFNGDSTVGKHHVDLDLLFEKGMPVKNTRIYRVGEINVFPSYDLSTNRRKALKEADTVKINGYNYIDTEHNFRPEIIVDVINLKKDSLYRRIDHEYSLIHLMGLQTFKYVNIKFRDSKKDSSLLIADVYMIPLLKKSIRFQVQGVSKSNNFVGPGFQFTFSNRNIFRGAELFQLKLHSAYEVQITRQVDTPLNSFEAGAEASLSVPRLLTPFGIKYNSERFLPATQFKVGYNFQERLNYFSLTTFNVSYGYTWRETTLKTHELYPVDISFVESGNRSRTFDSLLNFNPVLKNSFQNQFILGSRYSFTINTQFTEDIEEKFKLKERRKSNFYFKGTLDISGNILNALQKITTSGDNKIFGSPYSQYVRGDIDFRYYLLTGKARRSNMIATRLIVGVGNAFGNSTNMPYIKQFSIGGSNSIRAFPARSLGPGVYNVRGDSNVKTFFLDQRGDIKLEANAEYRFGIVKALKGAVFLDAGNIWLWNTDNSRPGANFDNDKFLSEIAVGTGFGVRYDFSFFVLRFDVAFPLRKPFILDENQRWVIDKVDFGSGHWRSENLILNIAIGYPF